METAFSEVIIKSFASEKQSFWCLPMEAHKHLEMCEHRVKEKKKEIAERTRWIVKPVPLIPLMKEFRS